MTRKVYLTVTTRTLVPVIATCKVVAVVEEGVAMEDVAKAAIEGQPPAGVHIEDTGIDTLAVEGAEDPTAGVHDQVVDALTSEGTDSTILTYEVTDSK